MTGVYICAVDGAAPGDDERAVPTIDGVAPFDNGAL